MVASTAECMFGGRLESGGRSYAGAFGRNLRSVVMMVFSHLINLCTRIYRFCTFNAICRDNDVVTCMIVRH